MKKVVGKNTRKRRLSRVRGEEGGLAGVSATNDDTFDDHGCRVWRENREESLLCGFSSLFKHWTQMRHESCALSRHANSAQSGQCDSGRGRWSLQHTSTSAACSSGDTDSLVDDSTDAGHVLDVAHEEPRRTNLVRNSSTLSMCNRRCHVVVAGAVLFRARAGTRVAVADRDGACDAHEHQQGLREAVLAHLGGPPGAHALHCALSERGHGGRGSGRAGTKEESRQTRGTVGKREAEEEDVRPRIRERADAVVVAAAARVPERHTDAHAIHRDGRRVAVEQGRDVVAVRAQQCQQRQQVVAQVGRGGTDGGGGDWFSKTQMKGVLPTPLSPTRTNLNDCIPASLGHTHRNNDKRTRKKGVVQKQNKG